MGIALPGLATGMDSAALIRSLMQVEAIPQTLLKQKVSATQGMVTSLQAFNTKIAALGDLSKALTAPGALNIFTATSSSPDVTAKAGSGATAGSVDFVVDKIAQTHTGVTAGMSAWPVDPPVLTVVASDGTRTEITAASTNLDDVVSAVNGAGAGITAMKVDNGDGTFRLQLTATESGAAGTFTAYRGSSADIDAGTAVDLFTETGAAVVKTGQDASVTLWAGTAAAQTVTSSTNTFTGLLPDVDVTVTKPSGTAVTVTIARDDQAVTGEAEGLVNALNELFNYVKANSAISTSSEGTTKGSVFTGDSTVRGVNQSILSAASMPVAGRSPSEVGISITRDGTLTFDAEKFASVLASDPAFAEAALQEISTRVEAAATVSSDKYTGLITSKIQGQETLVTSLNNQVEQWDLRLAKRQGTLERIYSALEVQISNMNAQSAWLASQVASLPQSSS
jgi:flagellar hook-associated protein 2